MLTSFPPLLSEVREERREVWEEGGSWRLYWLCWGWKLFLFFPLSACLASPLYVNSPFPVYTALVVVVCSAPDPFYLEVSDLKCNTWPGFSLFVAFRFNVYVMF